MSLNEVPGLKPPPGIESNFTNPPTRNAEAHVALAVSIVLIFSSVSVRAYSKIFCMKKIAFQDVLVFLSLGPAAGCLWVLYTFLLGSGFYIHQWDVTVEQLLYILHIFYIAMVLYEVSMACLKVSILSEWIQIFVPHGTRNRFFWTSATLIAVNVAYYLSAIVAISVTCPTRATLCARSTVIFVSSATINLTSDLVILALPIHVIWKLQLPRRKKIAISFVFGLGIITCAAAAIRLYMSVGLYTSADKTYKLSGTSLWCVTELTIAYLVFCAPAAPKAFQGTRFSRAVFGTSGSSSGGSSGRKRMIIGQQHGGGHHHHLAAHPWRQIEHDEEGSVPLRTFHASARGGSQEEATQQQQQLPARAIRVVNHVAVSTGTIRDK
ncbi:hypothetical protein F5Y17DRAFT_451024 [Xylariaceae sp. FL0594]|nr:hypothetical protein F5Y17DRAFT_451024 [Xylariaceae sp. FL0594]